MTDMIDLVPLEGADTDWSDPPLADWEAVPGPLVMPDGRLCIGRVAAPPQLEATSSTFYFWVPEGVLVEDTEIVTCESTVGGVTYTYYALIEEVRRQSGKRSMGVETGEADGDLAYEPPFAGTGFTYAKASVLRTEPTLLAPPRERSRVFRGNEAAAQLAYGADEIQRPLTVGLVKNGGSSFAGAGVIDLDYLLGANGGHMNVNGAAGRGTKSSFLLWVNWMLLHVARQQKQSRPSDPDRLRIVPIILNVKNFDLFYIDQWSRVYNADQHAGTWKALGIEAPAPFTNVTFYAAQQAHEKIPVPTGRPATGKPDKDVKPYSWSLRDVVQRGLLQYLFAEADAEDANFSALILDIENWLTDETVASDSSVTRSLRNDKEIPTTFAALLKWVEMQAGKKKDEERRLLNHHGATWKKLHRRLMKIVYESKGVLRRDDEQGNPLDLIRSTTSDPLVVDLNALAGEPELQRFVVATIFRQLVEARTGTSAVHGLVYVITLDELNRFAPHGAHDPITRLIETVAAEMRSQGIILLGAQQQASKVSEKIIENAAIRVLGKTGGLELNTVAWRFLSASARRKAERLAPNEKLVMQDNFAEPLHVQVPFPAWAMNPNERNLIETRANEDSDDLDDFIRR